MSDHLPLARHQLQRLGYILADLAQPLVTAWADRNVIAKLNAAAKGDGQADRARSARRSRRRHSAARPANSRGTWCSSKVRNREVVADHQGCQHPGGVRPDARTKPQGLERCDAQAMTALGQPRPCRLLRGDGCFGFGRCQRADEVIPRLERGAKATGTIFLRQ
jgi:hypothetical protein